MEVRTALETKRCGCSTGLNAQRLLVNDAGARPTQVCEDVAVVVINLCASEIGKPKSCVNLLKE